MADLALPASRLPETVHRLHKTLRRARCFIGVGLILVFLAVVLDVPTQLPLQPASWLTFIALIITPGYLLSDIVVWRLDMDWLERLALAMPLGVAVMALPGMASMLGHKTIQDLAIIWKLTVGVLIVIWLVHGLLVRRKSTRRDSRWALDEIIMLLLLTAAFIYMFPTLSLYKMDGDAYAVSSFTADAMTGRPLNATEPLLGSDTDMTAVRMGFNQLLPIFHLWSYLPQLDHIELTGYATRSMLALWAMLASYMLGKAAGNGSRRFGLFTATIQTLIYMAAPFLRTDSVSVFFFERINADKFTVTVTMLPVVVALAISFVRLRRRDIWMAAAIATFAVSSIHALIAAMLALALGAFGGLHLLLNLRRRQAWIAVIGLALLTVIVMSIPLVQLVMARTGDQMASTYPSSFEGWSVGDRLMPVFPYLLMRSKDIYGPLPNLAGLDAEQANTAASPFLIWRYAVNMRRGRIILFDLQQYMSDPAIFLEPPYLLTLLLLPFLLPGLRSNLGAQYALGTSLAILFVMFNPILTPILGALVVPWILWRFVWLLPYALTIALVARRVLNVLIRALTHLPRLRPARARLLACAPLAVVIVATLLLRPNILDNIEEMHARGAGPFVYRTPEKLFDSLREETAHGDPVLVLADENLSVSIPAFIGNADVVAHRILSTSEFFPADQQDLALQRHLDQHDFLNTPLLTRTHIDTLQRYDIRYVILPSGTSLEIQLRLSPKWFEWLVDDQSYSLYVVRETPPVTESIHGNAAMLERDWETAQQHYNRALEQDPFDLLALLGMAQLHRNQGKFDQALATLQQASANMESPALHYRLGQMYADLGEVESSIAEFELAQRGAPSVSRYHMALGDACLNAQRTDCAREHYEAAVRAQGLPDQVTRLMTLADIWRQRDNDELALALYEEAAAIQPHQRTQLLLASIYLRMEELDKAEALSRGLWQEHPLSPSITSSMAQLMEAKGEADQAIALYRRAIWLQSLRADDTHFTRLTLARTLLEAGRLDEASAEIGKVLAQRPNNASAYMLLGDLYREQNQPYLATAAYRLALKLDPTQAAIYASLSDQYRQMAVPPDETLVLLQMGTEFNPDQVSLVLSLGDQFERLGDFEMAIATYRLALDILEYGTPSLGTSLQSIGHNQALAYSRLAQLLEDTGRVDIAMSYYSAAVAAAPTESWARVTFGDALRRRNQVTAAEQTYQRAIQIDPTDIEAYLRLASLLSIRGDAAAAAELHQEAVQAALSASDSARTSRAWLGLGNFYSQSHQQVVPLGSDDGVDEIIDPQPDPIMQKALDAYNQALQAENSLDAVSALARLYQEIGQADQAIELYQKRIEEEKQAERSPVFLARYYVGLADIYLREELTDQAAAAYMQAVELDGWWPMARLGLARALSAQGDQAGALAELQKTVEIEPGSVEAQLALANALDQQGEKDRALAIYQATAQARPGNAAANLALARAWQNHNRWDEAERSYRQVMAVLPGDVSAYVGLSNLYVLQNRYAEAETLLRRAIPLDRTDATAYLRLGELLARQARYAGALAACEEALQISPGDWQVYVSLAGVYQALGEVNQALQSLRMAAAIDQTTPTPLLQLASIYREQNQPDQAEEMYLRAIDRSPTDAAFRQALAEFYQSRAMGDEALIQLRLAVEENPNSIVALVSYGNQLRLQALDEEAEEVYRQAEEAGEPTAAGYRALAMVRQIQARQEEALDLLDQAIAYAPDDAMNWIQKGQLQMQLGDSPSAVSSLEQATQLGPGLGQTWYSLGNTLLAAGNAQEALAAFERAVAVEPTYLPIYETLLDYYLGLGQNTQALETLEAARSAVPGSYLGDVYAARFLEEQRQWDEARGLLEQAIAKAPGLPDPYVAMAELEQLQNNMDQAISWYEQAIRLHPGDQVAATGLIDLLLKIGHNQEALAETQQALESRPGDSELMLRLGRVQQILGNFTEAELALLKATDLNPADSRAYAELAGLYLARGNPEAAMAAYQQAIALNPGDESNYVVLSRLWSMQGQPDQALIVLEDALSNLSRPIPVYVALSDLHLRQGEPGRALEVLEEAIQQGGEDSQLLQALGAYYLSQADFGRAEQVYQQMLASEPDQAGPYLALADLYLQRGRIGDAQNQYDHALALDPANSAVYLALGRFHQRLGEIEEAIGNYSHALSLNPTLDNAYVSLAALYRSQARWADAQATYEQGLAVMPTSTQLLIQYANFLLQRGDIWGALAVLDQAINLSARAETLIARSDILLSLDRVEEAKQDLQKAIEIEPGSVNAWISLGNLYSAQDDLVRAEQAYRQAVALSPGAATGYLSLADLAYDQGELDEAWRLYQTATRVEPASANLWVRLGQARSGQEDWAEAESAYRQAISLSPLATEAYTGMSDVVWGSSANLEQALDWLQQADKPSFDLAAVYNAMGDMYRQAGQSGLTAEYFQRVVSLEPGSVEGYLALSELYLAQGLPWEAEHYATLALDVSPRSPAAYISLGDIYLALGDVAKAEEHYRSAQELDTTPTEGYSSLANLYVAQGQYTQAIDAYQEALQLDPSNWSLLIAIGDVYLLMGESDEEDEDANPLYYDQALAAYQQAVEVAPEEWSAWIALGTLYADVDENDAALSAFDQATRLNPESPEPLLRKGDAYQAKGDVWAAQATFEQARSLSPEDTGPLLSLAALFQEQGDLDTAERYAYQAIQIDPLDAASYITLGGILEDGSYTLSRFRRVLTDVDKAKAAAAYYWKAIQLNPRQIGSYRSWLNLQVDAGLRHRDLAPLQMALEELAHGPEAETLQGHVALGLGYLTLEGPTDRAMYHLQQAGVLDPEFAELYAQIARAYEERMDSRLAIDSWRRYVYAATATGSDTSEGLAHIAWLRGVRIEAPADGANVSGPVQVVGAATREDFLFYTLEYTPVGQREVWITIGEPCYEPVDYGLLGTWETGQLAAGDYLLRVKVVETDEGYGPYDQVTVSVGSAQGGEQAESGPSGSAALPASMLTATTPAQILSPPTGEFTLLSPLSIEDASNGQVNFEWEWSGDIPPGSGFEVRVWREGEPPLGAHNSVLDNRYGLIEDLGGGRYRLSMDISAAAGVQGRASNYLWTVALVQIDPAYADLGLQAEPARLRYDGGGAVDHIGD